MTDYFSVILTGFSTGIGFVAAQHIYELWFKPRMKRTHRLSIALKREFGKVLKGK